MKYRLHGQPIHTPKSKRLRLLFITVAFIVSLIIVLAVLSSMFYRANLRAVNTSSQTVAITVSPGDNTQVIAKKLKAAKLIRNEYVFEYYARIHNASQYLQAGTYNLAPNQSIPTIIAQLTHGKVATSLVTILPGQRLDQIRQSLIEQGFSAAAVDAALAPAQYENSAVFAGKPVGNSLEGYLYPDSFQRSAETTPNTIIEQSLTEMQKHLTPGITAAFAKQGLTPYQGIIIASIVEKEVTKQSDRSQAAQVFLKRLQLGMPLGSDVTAFYGSELAGRGQDVRYDTPYNTRIHTGLPPTPISNVSESSLQAVAHPSATDWLFFVAGDDGTTYFSKTQAEHEALTAQYCHRLCQ